MTTVRYLSQRAFRIAGAALLRAGDVVGPRPKLSGEEQKLLMRNNRFKNRHQNQRCFVIGTGPSLQTQDLRPLADEVTFTLSAFWKHPIVETWQPTYYCFSDPLTFDGSAIMKEFFANVGHRVPDTTFFVPVAAHEVIERQSLLPPKQTYHLAFNGDLSTQDVSDLDLTSFIPGVMNVAQLCIMLAIYMGASPIYLLGLDHDWLAHQGETKHFYSGHAGLEEHPEVKPVLRDWGYKFLMECQLAGWNAYERLSSLAVRQSISILNATGGGFLDVFPRVNYEEVLRMAPQIQRRNSDR